MYVTYYIDECIIIWHSLPDWFAEAVGLQLSNELENPV